jgi:hypothetical protein
MIFNGTAIMSVAHARGARLIPKAGSTSNANSGVRKVKNPEKCMRAFFPLILGQNQTPENHAKLLFRIEIPSGPFLSVIYLDPVSYLMEPTGQVTCPVGSTSS